MPFLFREVQEELLQKARERVSKEICLSLIEEGVLCELQGVAEEVWEEAKAERDAKLQLLASHVIRKRTARFFKRYGVHIFTVFSKLQVLSKALKQ